VTNMRPLTHVLGLIFNRPQLMAPELMYEAVAFARSHLGLVIADGPAVSGAGAVIRMDAGDDPSAGSDPDDESSGVAVIGIYGPLVPRRGNVQMCTRMTSYESVAAQLDQALADPSITQIVLDIDSPGGAATGCFELADRIRAANAVKPVTAIVNFQAFSGGYMIAAAAGEIVVSQSSGVGSVGVIAQHFDVSKMDEAMGVKVTAIYRGARKNDLNPHEPLSDASLATLNAMIDRTYDQFTGYVSNFRGLPLQAVKDTEAGLYFGQDAIAAGLADRLETPQEAINRIAATAQAAKTASLSPTQPFVTSPSAQKMRLAAAAMEMQTKL
jgi:signal peptide peptidase SppA